MGWRSSGCGEQRERFGGQPRGGALSAVSNARADAQHIERKRFCRTGYAADGRAVAQQGHDARRKALVIMTERRDRAAEPAEIVLSLDVQARLMAGRRSAGGSSDTSRVYVQDFGAGVRGAPSFNIDSTASLRKRMLLSRSS
jgi:hypothetical protein